MRSALAGALTAAASLLMLAGAGAARADDVFGGLSAHAIAEAHGREDDSFDTIVGYRTNPIDALSLIWKPQVHAILAINDKYSTHFAAVGLDWKIRLPANFYFRPGIGLAYTTGKAGIPAVNAPGLTPQEIADRYHVYITRIDFGDHILFEPEFAIGYTFNPKWSVELSYVHLSNGQILHQGRNEGVDDLGLRLGYHFH